MLEACAGRWDGIFVPLDLVQDKILGNHVSMFLRSFAQNKYRAL